MKSKLFAANSLVVAISLMLCCQSAATGMPNEAKDLDIPSIQVKGTADINFVPDLFVVFARVRNVDKTSTLAFKANIENCERLLTLARKCEIPAKDIQTVDQSVSPIYKKDSLRSSGEVENRITGYSASREVRIQVGSQSVLSKLLDQAMEIESVSLESVRYDSSKVQEYLLQARLNALKIARKKAEMMAEEAGCKLGRALKVVEDESTLKRDRHFDRFRDFGNVTNTIQLPGDEPTIVNNGTAGLSAGQIGVRCSVSVTYKLE